MTAKKSQYPGRAKEKLLMDQQMLVLWSNACSLGICSLVSLAQKMCVCSEVNQKAISCEFGQVVAELALVGYMSLSDV